MTKLAHWSATPEEDVAKTAQDVYRAISRILGAPEPPRAQREALLALGAALPPGLTEAASSERGDPPGVARALADALSLVDRRLAIADEAAHARDRLGVTRTIATAIAAGAIDLDTLAAELSAVLSAEVRVFARDAPSSDPLVRWARALGRSLAYDQARPAELAIRAPRPDERDTETRAALVALGATLGLVIASDQPSRFDTKDLRAAEGWVALLEQALAARAASDPLPSLAASILGTLELGVAVLGPRAEPLLVNRAAAHLLAARPRELIARAGALPPLITAATDHAEGLLIRENGKPVAVSVHRAPLAHHAELVTITPLTHTRHELAQWRFLAAHDPLTGLLNRHGLAHALAGLVGQRVAVLYLDLDHFKAHNDRYGHLAGDRIVIALARRIGLAVTSEDLVARIGGDEFVVVHPVAHALDLRRYATRLRAQLVTMPVTVSGRQLGLSISVGAALETVVPDLDRLVAGADQAMYVAKRTGSKVEVFTARLARATPSGLLESDAFDALRTRDQRAIIPRATILEDLATQTPRGAELTLAWARTRPASPRAIARERHLGAAYNELLLEALAGDAPTREFVAIAPVRPDPRLVARIERLATRPDGARVVLIIEADELVEPSWFDDAARASRAAHAAGLRVAVRWNFRVGGEIAQLARIRPDMAWLELTRDPRDSVRFLEGMCRLATTLGMQVVLANRPARPRIERARLLELLPGALIVRHDAGQQAWRRPG